MKLKIISIHIPKTAGRSFYQVLKWVYNEKADIPRNRDKHVKDGIFYMEKIPPETEILHGHFSYSHIKHLHKKYNPAIITWLRDPVARIISNYYYNVKMNQLKPWKSKSEIRTSLSLPEFARKPNQVNRMSKILDGIAPESLFFVGLVEYYQDHLEILAKKLDWPLPLPEFHINKGNENYSNPYAPTPHNEITESMKEEIRQINQKDLNLYEKCRNLTIQ